MTDRTPTTEAGREMLALIDPHWVGSILAIEDEARALAALAARSEPPPDVGAAHTIVDGEVVWCALLEAQEAARSEPTYGLHERTIGYSGEPAPALDVERIEALEYPENVTSGESSTSPSWYHGHANG